jgi:protein involved in polysaccharide export with SLBB domain
MKSGGQSKRGTLGKVSQRPRPWVPLLLGLATLAGCASDRASVEKNLMATVPTPEEEVAVARGYRVSCPDVIAVRVINRPDLHWTAAVDVDGTLPVDYLARPRVEGRSVDEIGRIVAARLGVPERAVLADVSEYRSKRVYVFGQVKDAPQAIPYRGPETVLELLQRVGGITPGAEPGEVFVIRPNIAEGKRPEVYHVDLRAIVLQKDQSTNLRLQPFDQVHVGETPQAQVERCIPPWMRPFHWALWDTRPDNQPPATALQKRLHDARRDFAERSLEEQNTGSTFAANLVVSGP